MKKTRYVEVVYRHVYQRCEQLLHICMINILYRRKTKKMKYLKQFLIILAISFIGEILKYIVPLPIPASIYGMVIMFICLQIKILKLDDVKSVGKFLIEIMPVMFIPAGVGLMSSWGTLKPVLVPVSVITVVVIITVMLASGWVSQLIIRRNRKKETENE